MCPEIPKGIRKAIGTAKESEEYRRKALTTDILNLCNSIIGNKKYIPPIFREIDDDTVAFKLDRVEQPNNGDSIAVTTFRIAVNPSSRLAVDDKEYHILFTDTGFGIKDRKYGEPTIKELGEYLEALVFFRDEARKDQRKKR